DGQIIVLAGAVAVGDGQVAAAERRRERWRRQFRRSVAGAAVVQQRDLRCGQGSIPDADLVEIELLIVGQEECAVAEAAGDGRNVERLRRRRTQPAPRWRGIGREYRPGTV